MAKLRRIIILPVPQGDQALQGPLGGGGEAVGENPETEGELRLPGEGEVDHAETSIG